VSAQTRVAREFGLSASVHTTTIYDRNECFEQWNILAMVPYRGRQSLRHIGSGLTLDEAIANGHAYMARAARRMPAPPIVDEDRGAGLDAILCRCGAPIKHTPLSPVCRNR